MSKRNAVHQAYDRFGSEAGFEKKSGSWFRTSSDVIEICNLQKSQYSPKYYLNVSFWLRELGDERYPKAHQSHIVARAESLVPSIESRLEELLDLEYAISDEVRIFELVALLNENLLPIFERAKTMSGLRSLAAEGTFRASGVRGAAQRVLGLDD
jgi:hypothetical protein